MLDVHILFFRALGDVVKVTRLHKSNTVHKTKLNINRVITGKQSLKKDEALFLEHAPAVDHHGPSVWRIAGLNPP